MHTNVLQCGHITCLCVRAVPDNVTSKTVCWGSGRCTVPHGMWEW